MAKNEAAGRRSAAFFSNTTKQAARQKANSEMTTTSATIAQAARQIAGSIFEDAEGTLEQRLEACVAWKNRGMDCDLSYSDRQKLELLYDVATGITSDLYDSDTAEVIREATDAEAIESALAGPEGHIMVDGRRCYVAV